VIDLDHNRIGTVYGLTVITAIKPGLEQEVRSTIEGLPRGEDGPFSRLERLHFARLQIFDHLVYQGAPQRREKSLRSNYLVFTASFDGERDAFLDAICERMPAEAESWWGHCVAYPGTVDRDAFRRWLEHNQVPTHLFSSPYPTATVQDVRESLALRDQVVDFAISAQGLPARELQERFRQAFAGVR
jgi:hypothetical protein